MTIAQVYLCRTCGGSCSADWWEVHQGNCPTCCFPSRSGGTLSPPAKAETDDPISRAIAKATQRWATSEQGRQQSEFHNRCTCDFARSGVHASWCFKAPTRLID